MANPAARLDDDEIDADRECRQTDAVRQPVGKQPPDRRPEMRPLPMVETLVGEAEVAPSAPAHLDDDELARRPMVDGDDVQLAPADPDIPSKDEPAIGRQAIRDEALGGISAVLEGRPHPATISAGPSLPLIPLSGDCLEHREIGGV
jgi:hypothetical protein